MNWLIFWLFSSYVSSLLELLCCLHLSFHEFRFSYFTKGLKYEQQTLACCQDDAASNRDMKSSLSTKFSNLRSPEQRSLSAARKRRVNVGARVLAVSECDVFLHVKSRDCCVICLRMLRLRFVCERLLIGDTSMNVARLLRSFKLEIFLTFLLFSS